jgi:hypothetical protein
VPTEAVLWIQAVVSQFAYIDDRTFSIRQLHPILASRRIELNPPLQF